MTAIPGSSPPPAASQSGRRAPFTQTMRTPFGQMEPTQFYRQRDAFIQSANDQAGRSMANAGTYQGQGRPPASWGRPTQYNPQQMWSQSGQMVQQGWQNPYSQDAGQRIRGIVNPTGGQQPRGRAWGDIGATGQQPANAQQVAPDSPAAMPPSYRPEQDSGAAPRITQTGVAQLPPVNPFLLGPDPRAEQRRMQETVDPRTGGTIWDAPENWAVRARIEHDAAEYDRKVASGRYRTPDAPPTDAEKQFMAGRGGSPPPAYMDPNWRSWDSIQVERDLARRGEQSPGSPPILLAPGSSGPNPGYTPPSFGARPWGDAVPPPGPGPNPYVPPPGPAPPGGGLDTRGWLEQERRLNARQQQPPPPPQQTAAQFRAAHLAAVNSPQTQQWLAGLTPANQSIYSLMMGMG